MKTSLEQACEEQNTAFLLARCILVAGIFAWGGISACHLCS